MNVTKCQTCCLFNGICLSATLVSDIILTQNPDLIKELHKRKETSERKKFYFHTKVCYNSNCISLSFRNVDLDDYCLLFGKVGNCKYGNQCYVKNINQVFPSVRSSLTNEINRAKAIIFKAQYAYVTVITIFNYFGNIISIYTCLYYYCNFFYIKQCKPPGIFN